MCSFRNYSTWNAAISRQLSVGNCHKIGSNQGEDESRKQEGVQINLACTSSVKQVIRFSSGTFPWQRWPTKKKSKEKWCRHQFYRFLGRRIKNNQICKPFCTDDTSNKAVEWIQWCQVSYAAFKDFGPCCPDKESFYCRPPSLDYFIFNFIIAICTK